MHHRTARANQGAVTLVSPMQESQAARCHRLTAMGCQRSEWNRCENCSLQPVQQVRDVRFTCDLRVRDRTGRSVQKTTLYALPRVCEVSVPEERGVSAAKPAFAA